MNNKTLFFLITVSIATTFSGCTQNDNDKETKNVTNTTREQIKNTTKKNEPAMKEKTQTNNKNQVEGEVKTTTNESKEANETKENQKELPTNSATNTQLPYKITELIENNVKITINDLHQNNIYNVPIEKLSDLNNQIITLDIKTINTKEKFVAWIEKHYPQTHVFLLLTNETTLESWKALIATTNSHFKIYAFSINDNSSTITLHSWPPATPIKIFIDLPPLSKRDDRSLHIKQSLISTADYLTQENMSSEIHWIASTTENSDGNLFNAQLKRNDLINVLIYWTRTLRSKNLGIIDFGHAGNKSSFYDLSNFCPFSKSLISNDNPIKTPSKKPFANLIEEASSIDKTNISLALLLQHKKENNETTLFKCKEFLTFKRHIQNETNKLENNTKNFILTTDSIKELLRDTDQETTNNILEKFKFTQ